MMTYKIKELTFEKICNDFLNTDNENYKISKLTNGSPIINVGSVGEVIFILSGVHGDEKSGPMALLQWLSSENLIDICKNINIQFIIVPLLNNLGWDGNQREWNGTDLNRTFGIPGQPEFLSEIINLIKETKPIAFIDLHEDSETDYPYLFEMNGDKTLLVEHLISKIENIKIEPWENTKEWEGSSEVIARNCGAIYCTTTEVPTTWDLEKRINLQKDFLKYFLDFVLYKISLK